MTIPKLGLLESVPLRDIFGSEAGDFTPWLAKPENLKLLGDSIGIDIELDSQEKDVGPFRADILCKDLSNDQWVLIENQFERTDHAHLGQLLTYAAGLEAITIVWIAERFTEEHRAVLDWLNERTDEKINLFGLEIELWKIGESPVAPRFNIVSKPNYWTQSVKEAAEGKMTEHKQLQLEFWKAFRDYMERSSKIRCQKPSPQHWMNHAIGISGVHLNSIVSIWNTNTGRIGPEIRVELVLNDATAKDRFVALQEKKAEIEEKLGMTLTWHNPEDKNMCRIFTRTDTDFREGRLWPEQHEWLRENLEAFHRVFAPLVRDFSRS